MITNPRFSDDGDDARAERRAIAIGVKYVIDLLANPTPEQEAASDNLLADIFDARTYRRRSS